MDKERYENLDGLRAYACIGIVLMHVLSNLHLGLTGFVYESFIPSLTHFVPLFLLVSAFSLCCGYYERFQNNSISLEQFYRKRYQRIWPFFALLCTVELIFDHSLSSLYEWFADLTLAFGLLPNADISVVGVGWFLGLIFAFYMLFPFFVFLIGNRKRAWFVFGITIILNVLCQIYFFDGAHVVKGFVARKNLIYVAMFFIAGGLLYLYREEIKNSSKAFRVIDGAVLVGSVIAYYTVAPSIFTILITFITLTILAILAGGGYCKTHFSKQCCTLYQFNKHGSILMSHVCVPAV